jgi:putative addiction module killer protein
MRINLYHYVSADGVDSFQAWLDRLRDTTGRIAIDRRVERLVGGNFGDHAFCREGVWELRINFGPGCRVYYAQVSKEMVLVLLGGDKRSQDQDISDAVRNWGDFLKWG